MCLAWVKGMTKQNDIQINKTKAPWEHATEFVLFKGFRMFIQEIYPYRYICDNYQVSVGLL